MRPLLDTAAGGAEFEALADQLERDMIRVMEKKRMTTPDPSTYTTSELERLARLNNWTALRPGEFAHWRGNTVNNCIHMRVQACGDKVIANSNGGLTDDLYAPGLRNGLTSASVLRRVRSFTDRTEIDPPQAAMERELARRRLAVTFTDGERVRCASLCLDGVVEAPSAFDTNKRMVQVRVGEVVYPVDPVLLTKLPALRFRQGDVVACTYQGNYGHLAAVTADCGSHDSLHLKWDARLLPTDITGTRWDAAYFRLATPADIAAFEARIPQPKPVVFAPGDLVVSRQYETTWGTMPVVKKWGHSESYMCRSARYGDGSFDTSDLRPATDAEVAAYHRQHCGAKNAPQAEPAKTAISNATHAGRRVRARGDATLRTFIVLAPATCEKVRTLYPYVPADQVWLIENATGELHTRRPNELELL